MINKIKALNESIYKLFFRKKTNKYYLQTIIVQYIIQKLK